MANSYATVADYEARYGTLGDSAAARVSALLDDAALYLAAAVGKYGIKAEGKAAELKIVCCTRVHYLEERGDGLSSRTQQAGPYSYTVSYTQGLKSFDAWLREQFSDLLGIWRGGVACVPLGFGDEDE